MINGKTIEIEEIIQLMMHEVIQVIKFMKETGKCPCEVLIIPDLIKESGEEFTKM